MYRKLAKMTQTVSMYPVTRLPLILMSSISVVLWSKWWHWRWYITINCTPDFIWILPFSPPLFCSVVSPRALYYACLYVSLSLQWSVMGSQSSFWMTLTVSRSTGQILCRMSLSVGFVWCFSDDRSGVTGSWAEKHRRSSRLIIIVSGNACTYMASLVGINWSLV